MKKSFTNIVVLFLLFLYPVFIFAGTHQFENGKIEIAISTKKEYDAKQYPLETSIVSFINGASKTLDMAVEEIRWGRVVQGTNPIKKAIRKRADAGVKVRIILEKSYLKPGSDNQVTFDEFTAHPNIEVVADGNSAIMHNKFVVRDYGTNKVALPTGSTNFTDTGVRRNYNHVFILHFTGSRKKYFDILDRYNDEFKEMWGGTYGNKEPGFEVPYYRFGNTTIRILHSPDDDPDDYLLKAVTDAKSSIDVMMFTFGSNSPLMSGVINRFYAVKYVNRKPTDEKKVKIRVGMESQQARYWSAHPTLKELHIPLKLEKIRKPSCITRVQSSIIRQLY